MCFVSVSLSVSVCLVCVFFVCVVACLTFELCFGTSRSVLDPSWFGLRPFPCVKGSYFRPDFKGPAPSLTQTEYEKTNANDIFNVLDKCGFVFTVASFQNSLVLRRG